MVLIYIIEARFLNLCVTNRYKSLLPGEVRYTVNAYYAMVINNRDEHEKIKQNHYCQCDHTGR